MFKKKPKKPAPSATKDRSNIYTTGQIGRTRETTPEGYLLCRDVPVARIGVKESALCLHTSMQLKHPTQREASTVACSASSQPGARPRAARSKSAAGGSSGRRSGRRTQRAHHRAGHAADGAD